MALSSTLVPDRDPPAVPAGAAAPPIRALILCGLLPYLKTSPLGSDVQPHYFLAVVAVAIYYFAARSRLIFDLSAVLLGYLLSAAALLLGAGTDAVALFFLPISVSIMARARPEDVLWALKAATLIYLAGLALQMVAPPAVAALTSNSRFGIAIYAVRGYTSFASEPSYLGLVGVVLAVGFAYLRGSPLWVALASLLVFSSGSLTAIAPLIVILGLRYLSLRNLPFYAIAVPLLALLVLYLADQQSRLGRLLWLLLEAPEQVFFFDTSFQNRIARALVPLYQAWQDNFVPHRYPDENDLFVSFEFMTNRADFYVERLSSLATVLVYVLGFFGFPLIAVYLAFARPGLGLLAAVVFLCVTNISVATPYIYLALALPFLVRALPAPVPDAPGAGRAARP